MQIFPEILATHPTPNYIDPETRGPGLLICNAVLFALAFVFVAARVYTRTHVSGGFGLDDLFIVAAIVCRPIPVADGSL